MMKCMMSSGVEIAYIDEGEGAPVILSHCSSSSHAMWRGLIDELTPRTRVLAPDFIGYGQSGAWHGERTFSLRDDAQILLDLAEIAGEPVHLVGHSYGGAVTIEALRLSRNIARAFTVIEPVSFFLLKLRERAEEWQAIEDLVDAVQRNVRAGDREAAAAAYMGFWIGPKNWEMTPEKARAGILATMDKVNSEFQTSKNLEGQSLANVGALQMPALLIEGERSPQPSRAVVEILSSLLPQARVETVMGAGHMSPMTHRDEINALVCAHVAECAPRAPGP
jgi:pimeloyl-ACP methyl ester carboxylesterase